MQILPPLTGQYAVGFAQLAIERLPTTHLIGDRRIKMEIYAPTKPNTGNKLLMRPNPVLEEMVGRQFSQEQLQELHTYSQDRIDPIGKWPIVLFSNGMGCDITEYRLLLEQLASHGYLVLNLNHSSSSSSVYDNVAPGEDPFANVDPKKLAAMQADNIQFVIEEIRNGSLKDLGQSDQIILAGHSLGGAASILVVQNDPTIKGCIDLDGALQGPASEPPVPTLLVTTSAPDPDLSQFDEETRENILERRKEVKEGWNNFSKHSNVESRTIEGVDHMDFSMCAMLYWLLGKPHLYLGTLKAHSVASQAMIQFMHSVVRK